MDAQAKRTGWLRILPSSGAAQWTLPVCLFLFSILLYSNSATNGFVLDDNSLVENNPLIRGVHKIPTLWVSDYWEPSQKGGLYRPLVMSSYALQFELLGIDPTSYHLVNIVLHALVSVLVYAFCRRLVRDDLIAAAAAFLFAAHAIHTEVVANVVGRAELMWTLFFLLSFLAYAQSQSAPGRRSAWLYAGSLTAFFLGLVTKESAITLLGVIVVYDFLYGSEHREGLVPGLRKLITTRWRAYSGFGLVTLAYLAIRILALGFRKTVPPPIHLDNPMVTLDLVWRGLTALQVAFRYLWLQLFPLNLSYDYSYNQIPMLSSLGDPLSWLILGLCVGSILLLLWSYRHWRDLFFVLVFYLATFSPVSNLVIVIGTIMGERLVYMPSLGFCLALALVLGRLCDRLPWDPRTGRVVFISLFAVIVGLNGVRTMVRNPDWKSKDSLFLHDVHVVPGSAKAIGNAASMTFGRKEYDKALELFRRAIAIEPHYAIPYRTAGFVYTETGRDEEAMEMYNLAIRFGADDPRLYNNMGFLLVDHQIDIERGIKLLESAVERRPKNPDFLDSLAWGYYKLGRLEEARDLLLKSLNINSRSPSAESRRAHLETIKEALAAKTGRPTPQ